MGVGWALIKVDPITREAIEGEEPFNPAFPMEDIDLLLVGKLEGPVMGLLQDPGIDEGGDEEIDPDSEETPSVFLPPAVVRRCAERLSAIPRERYKSMKTVVKKCSRTVLPGDERALYDDLIETTESLRKLITDAAARGYALECWLEGA
jgi:hypothetical protein